VTRSPITALVILGAPPAEQVDACTDEEEDEQDPGSVEEVRGRWHVQVWRGRTGGSSRGEELLCMDPSCAVENPTSSGAGIDPTSSA